MAETKSDNIKDYLTLCRHCGEPIGIFFTGIKLADGSHICVDCLKPVPPDYTKFAKRNWNYETYLDFLEYRKYSDTVLKETFTMTHRYKSVHVDETHGLFCIGEGVVGGITKDNLYYQMANIEDYRYDFEGKKADKSFWGNVYTYGVIRFQVALRRPYIYINTIVNHDAKSTKGTKKLFSKVYNTAPPKDFQKFVAEFARIHSLFRSSEDKQTSGNGAMADINIELERALALFMLDSLEGVTTQALKEQRNRLIKAFHPDADSTVAPEASQKINEAYELLSKYI